MWSARGLASIRSASSWTYTARSSIACSSRSQTETLVNAPEPYLVRCPSLPRVLPAGQYALSRWGRQSEYARIIYGAGGLSGLEPPRHDWPGVPSLGLSSP